MACRFSCPPANCLHPSSGCEEMRRPVITFSPPRFERATPGNPVRIRPSSGCEEMRPRASLKLLAVNALPRFREAMKIVAETEDETARVCGELSDGA